MSTHLTFSDFDAFIAHESTLAPNRQVQNIGAITALLIFCLNNGKNNYFLSSRMTTNNKSKDFNTIMITNNKSKDFNNDNNFHLSRTVFSQY